jgi:hypothetical protein
MTDAQPRITITRQIHELDELMTVEPVGSAERLSLFSGKPSWSTSARPHSREHGALSASADGAATQWGR